MIVARHADPLNLMELVEPGAGVPWIPTARHDSLQA